MIQFEPIYFASLSLFFRMANKTKTKTATQRTACATSKRNAGETRDGTQKRQAIVFENFCPAYLFVCACVHVCVRLIQARCKRHTQRVSGECSVVVSLCGHSPPPVTVAISRLQQQRDFDCFLSVRERVRIDSRKNLDETAFSAFATDDEHVTTHREK